MSESRSPAPEPRSRSRALEILLWLAVLGAAAGLRLFDLDRKPLHSDEGMNALFVRRLVEEGVYEYKPAEFHGPLLYFASALPVRLAGPSDRSLRLATALAGVGVVASLALYRPWLGATGALAAAALLAVSAPDVYFARTCIHETWLVLSLALAVGFALRALRGGSRLAFAAAGAGLALAAASKETFVISAAAIAAGLAVALLPGLREPLGPAPAAPADLRDLPRWLALRRGRLALAVLAALLVAALLFTSFLTRPRGLVALLEAAPAWLGYGVSGRNQAAPPGTFAAMWGWWAPVLLLAGFGAGFGAARRSRFAALMAVWFAATLAVYELVPYKTPWCALAIGLPLFPLAGYGVRALVAARPRALAGALAAVSLAAALAEGARASFDASFVRYDDPAIPFVYVQTLASFMDLVDDLDRLRAQRKRVEGEGAESRLVAVEPKNPLRWYLYSRGWPDATTRFYSRWLEPDEGRRGAELRSDLEAAEIAMVAAGFEWSLRQVIDPAGFVRRVYAARPGGDYVLFVRRDLARHLPEPGRARVDGGGQPLGPRRAAPPPFLPWLRGVESLRTR